MRQILIRVKRGSGERVASIAHSHNALDVTRWQAQNREGSLDMIAVHIENRSVGSMLEQLEGMSDLSVSFFPDEVLLIQPPTHQALPELKNLEERSPLEFFLHSVQSIGTWPSFLAYSVAGAIVVWIAFFTNSVFLLMAAMLVAPFAGPAMHVAVATAAGDAVIFRKSLVRYLAAIVVTLAVSAALSAVMQQEVMTDLMVSVSQVSAVAVLLPLTAGAAGALNLVQSNRSSLIPGAAVGILVAASLAPPAGLIGVAAVMGIWESVLNASFVLVLQLVGINLAGAAVFRIYGLTTQLGRFDRGRQRFFFASTAVTFLLLGALLFWQFSGPLRLQRSSEGSEATQTARQAIQESGLAEAVEIEATFPRAQSGENRILLVTGYVRRAGNVTLSNEMIVSQLQEAVGRRLVEQNPKVVPLIDLTLLEESILSATPPPQEGQ